MWEVVKMALFVIWFGLNKEAIAPSYIAYVAAPWCFFDHTFSIFAMTLSAIIFRFRIDWVPGTLIGCYCLVMEPSLLLDYLYAIVMGYTFSLCLTRLPLFTIILSFYGGSTYLIYE